MHRENIILLTALNISRKAVHGSRASCAVTATNAWASTTKFSWQAAAKVLRRRINDDLMRSGVTIIDPNATYIDADVCMWAGHDGLSGRDD